MKDTIRLGLAAVLAMTGCEEMGTTEQEVTTEETTALDRERQQREAEQQQRREQQTAQQQQQQAQLREQQARQQAQQGQQAQQQQQVPMNARIAVRTHETLGEHLVDANGRALYMFTRDTRRQSSECYDQCAQLWPPVLTRQDPQAGAQNVRDEMLGTIQRRDGQMQVTYNGWPLYTYTRDQQPGQATGQNVQGEWYLMAPSGERIEGEARPQRASR